MASCRRATSRRSSYASPTRRSRVSRACGSDAGWAMSGFPAQCRSEGRGHYERPKLRTISGKGNMLVRRFLLTVLLGVAACGAEAEPARRARVVVADVILSVTNGSERSWEISLERDTVEYFLGAVPGGETRAFSLPSGLGDSVAGLHFRAGPRIGQSIRSDAFSITRGQKASWTVNERGSTRVVTR